jgi:hypothetical protein
MGLLCARQSASIVGKFELLQLPRVEILARDDVEFAWVAGWERPALQLGVAVVHLQLHERTEYQY